MTLKPIFNIVGKEYEAFDKMSIIEFLREIKKGGRLPGRVTVVGLDYLLVNAKDAEEMSTYVRESLRDATGSGQLRPTSIIQFLVKGEITQDTHAKIKLKNEYINIENVFSGGVTRLGKDWLHAIK